jgi:hypothetical protein
LHAHAFRPVPRPRAGASPQSPRLPDVRKVL